MHKIVNELICAVPSATEEGRVCESRHLTKEIKDPRGIRNTQQRVYRTRGWKEIEICTPEGWIIQPVF